jgi:AsmA-like protein
LVEKPTSFWRRHRWILWIGGGLLALLAMLTAVVDVLAHRAEPYFRARIVEGLSQHFRSRVELDSLHLSMGNELRGEWGVWAKGRGLRIWPPAEVAGAAVPNSPQPGEPLIRLTEFGFHVPLRYQPGTPVYIGEVKLQGLEVLLPPHSHFMHASASAGGTAGAPKPSAATHLVRFLLGTIDCTNAHLVLETSKPGKLPMDFAIAHLRLTDTAPNSAMHFEAELTNPKPVGTVHSKGTFGPWQVDDPGESPVAGDYRFDHADLGTLKGIAGILSSAGRYQGTLRNITVDGETDTPDFRLSSFENTLALHTNFHAIVDGTNGDTWLDPVDAMLGRSHILAKGRVVRVLAPASDGPPHSIGHDIALKVDVDRGRIDDFLRLVSHESTSLLTGAVTAKATLHIPPGPAAVHERMALDGRFSLEQAQFTSTKIQDRIAELSFRGQGRPHDAKSSAPESIASNMRSDFKMAGGIITLPNLTFTVPGADIEANGTYALNGGALDFIGTARMEATVSKMVGGWKGMLLKPADRFFKKDGAGTQVPFHVNGTRKDPQFGVDLKRMKSTTPERPDEQPAPQSTPPS